MRIEQHIVAAWAKQLSDKLLEKSISCLEQMNYSGMLSGDDSGLNNVWEEICVQIQTELSFFWGSYVEMMESLLSCYVEQLDRDARLALWAVTDEGWDYIYDHHAEDARVEDVPVFVDEIVAKLMEELLSVAASYSNQRITRFVQRHEYGDDEFENEDYEDDGEEQEEEQYEAEDDPRKGGAERLFGLQPAVDRKSVV